MVTSRLASKLTKEYLLKVARVESFSPDLHPSAYTPT